MIYCLTCSNPTLNDFFNVKDANILTPEFQNEREDDEPKKYSKVCIIVEDICGDEFLETPLGLMYIK